MTFIILAGVRGGNKNLPKMQKRIIDGKMINFALILVVFNSIFYAII